ncbi:MAG: twin-arginine translocation signal domain-containing protein, partial [Deltaproteobacteria bacterium]|nr:twin-arginine translocation signal domain-containing protein [Deltaproteobacteria bacterium]
MNRRDLLKYTGAAGAIGLLAPKLSAAPAPASKRRLIMVMAQGGWDTSYALDPK